MSDGRIPVRVIVGGTGSGVDGAERLVLAGPAAPGHVPSCLCCQPRGALADALAALHLRRVRGGEPLDRPVSLLVDSAASATAARVVIANDRVARARFRLLDEL